MATTCVASQIFGIEHGLQHLQGVAASGEVMRDDQRDESNRARAGSAYPIAKNSLEHQAYNYRAPADEDGGRIKIGDGRPFLQIHPRNEAEMCERRERGAANRKRSD